MKLLLSYIAVLFSLEAQDLIVQPNDGAAPIIKAIDSARASVDIAIYRLDHEEVIEALIRANLRNINVRVLLNPPTNTSNLKSEIDLSSAWDKLKKNKETAEYLRKNGISVTYASLKDIVLFHTKLMIIDNKAAFVMTFNMNQSAFSCGRNFGYVTRNATEVKNLLGYFNNQINQLEFLDHPPSICFSPDQQRTFITIFMIQTRMTLDIYQATLTDSWIALYLHLMSGLGKKIRILITPDLFGRDESYDLRKKLVGTGIEFRYMTSPYVHAKLLIRDTASILITSCNFWADGLDRSGELSLIADDSESIQKAQQTFNTDWEQAQTQWISTNNSSLE